MANNHVFGDEKAALDWILELEYQDNSSGNSAGPSSDGQDASAPIRSLEAARLPEMELAAVENARYL